MDRILKTIKVRWILLISALAIVALSYGITRILADQLAQKERERVRVWADAIQQKATTMAYVESFFASMSNDERMRIETWSTAFKRMLASTHNAEQFEANRRIIEKNTTIPMIFTDARQHVLLTKNVNAEIIKQGDILKGNLLKEFSRNQPIAYADGRDTQFFLYYGESETITKLRITLDDLFDSFFKDIVENSISVPVIITDSIVSKVLFTGNIDTADINTPSKLHRTLHNMASQNRPLEISGKQESTMIVYYERSGLITRLKLFPFVMGVILAAFVVIVIMNFRITGKSEQDQLFVSMSRETAHQLGTPISSLMAWIEYLHSQDIDSDVVDEISKDVKRLEVISQRFSKIGSKPTLKMENLTQVIKNSVHYLSSRYSQKVRFAVHTPEDGIVFANINIQLFEWVLENLCKNAVDAIGNSEGSIDIRISETKEHVVIDVRDSGKGIAKANFETIFKAGYTSKTRGWGLGLALCKRIIEDYHQGSIFVVQSIIHKGTTFRILLKK